MTMQVLLKYPFVFLVGFLATFLLTPMVRRLAVSTGLVDQPDAGRVHKRATPLGGGLAVFLGFHFACAAVFCIPWTRFRGHLDGSWWWPFLLLSGLLAGIGIVDDRTRMRPIVKLCGQLVVASLAFAFDMRVGKLLGFHLPVAMDYAATVLWFLAIINAFNLIDGIDGLATGLAAVSSVGLAGSCLIRHLPGDALVLFGFAGACLAFLRYNFSPASIFLGDTGSMFLGFALASIALTTAAKGTAVAAIVVPLLAVGVPVFDMAMAIWRRTMRRMAGNASHDGPETRPTRIFGGDLDHIHHRLLRAGLSQRATAGWLYVLGGVMVAVGLLSMIYHSRAHGIYLLAFVVGAYITVRHLARVELWDTGHAFVKGLSRPPNRVLAVVLYPVVDIALLGGALAVSALFTFRGQEAGAFRHVWLDQVPLWVGLPFLVICLTRAYQRVWSRARISEYVVLAAALLAGILLAAGTAVVTGHSHAPLAVQVMDMDQNVIVVLGQIVRRGLALQIVVYAGVAIPLVAGMRAIPRAIQDALLWARRRRAAGDACEGNCLLLGAGFRCTLFLRDSNFAENRQGHSRNIVGLIDEDRNLHGRFVHGYRVLGGPDDIENLVREHDVKEVIVTSDLSPEGHAQLSAELRKSGVVVLEWRTELLELPASIVS